MLLNLGEHWIMRPTHPLRFFGISAVLALATLALPATAEDSNFDLTQAKGEIKVIPHAGWHINLDYSWSVKKGGDKIKTKGDFKLDKSAAVVSGVPAGSYTLKGAVCSESNCAPFAKEITVQ